MGFVEEYISNHTLKSYRYDAGELVRKKDEIEKELGGAEFRMHPRLKKQLNFLFGFVSKHFPDGVTKDVIPAFAEAVFALKYALSAIDYVPDVIPGIGRVDDALIVRTALKRNAPIYEAYAKEAGADWDSVKG